jgi:hypothetical protein
MTIFVKEMDILKSTLHQGKKITEYIVYLMIDEIAVEAYMEYGYENKNNRINFLKQKYKINNIMNSYISN